MYVCIRWKPPYCHCCTLGYHLFLFFLFSLPFRFRLRRIACPFQRTVPGSPPDAGIQRGHLDYRVVQVDVLVDCCCSSHLWVDGQLRGHPPSGLRTLLVHACQAGICVCVCVSRSLSLPTPPPPLSLPPSPSLSPSRTHTHTHSLSHTHTRLSLVCLCLAPPLSTLLPPTLLPASHTHLEPRANGHCNTLALCTREVAEHLTRNPPSLLAFAPSCVAKRRKASVSDISDGATRTVNVALTEGGVYLGAATGSVIFGP